ncbi:hypothetical protein LCGC14_0226030 [marine sediment metagenome]|uniref:Lipoprotein SmpA/OmlA domain-containing protein n=1 Tax=marine sediment metagenome TaxID=412755 RepID=A0A0F9UBV5_9ZZZZ|nr:hypothetical protein [Phycisphaerae bacterium]HDZ42944.1 hypothetical protein [Phycisphaerae bacterium]
MMTKSHVVLLALLALLIIVGSVGYWGYCAYWKTYHGYDPKPFSPAAWAAADAGTRGHMVVDLLAQHPLKGLTTQEVVDLLGPPDWQDTDKDTGRTSTITYEVGYMGYNPKALMVFSYRLTLEFGDDGTVREANVLD